MAFGGLSFIFNGEYSENYGLKIMDINGNFVNESSGGCGLTIFDDTINRNPTTYAQGVAQNEPLQFDMEFVSEEEIIGPLRSRICRWLFSRMEYSKLQIVQDDLADIFFNCHLTEPQFTYIGGRCHGISCNVQCDAPWAWQNEKLYQVSNLMSSRGMTDSTSYVWRHYNDTDDTDYLYPTMEFQMASSFVGNGRCSIINQNDNNRECLFTGLRANEIITVDCRHQLITSSTGLLVSDKFNKKFLRLVNGINNLQLTGEFLYLKLIYQNARKVGG